MTEKRFVLYEHKGADYILENPNTHLDFIEMLGDCLGEEEIVNRLNDLYEENEQLKQQLVHHTRMHEWFRNEAYLLQNKLDNREDEIRRLKGDVE